MTTFESLIQPGPGGALAAADDLALKAPIVVDAMSPKGLRPFTAFVSTLEHNRNTRIAAAEGRRLTPYFNMMSDYLNGVIDASPGLADKKEKKQAAKALVAPQNLLAIFNAAAERTGNTLTSEVVILPMNIEKEGPAARLFKGDAYGTVHYSHGAHPFNFGFLQVFEGGDRRQRNSTTMPTFMLDDVMLDAAAPYGIQGALRHFQGLMSLVNHDMLHHLTSPIINPVVADKFGEELYEDSPFAPWARKFEDENVDFDLYEGWSKTAHAAALWAAGPETTAEIAGQLAQYFGDLKRIGSEIAAEGADPAAAKARAHEVVDYFGTVMTHALSRSYPLDHPLMKMCLEGMKAADPAPERILAETLETATGSRLAGAEAMMLGQLQIAVLRRPDVSTIINSYRDRGLDMLPKEAPTYEQLKLLQLTLATREDIDPMVPAAPYIQRLQRDTGALTLSMFEAAAAAFDVHGPLELRPLARKEFNKVSATPDALFALPNAEAETIDLPDKLALAPVAEVVRMLAQPDFVAKYGGLLVGDRMQETLEEAGHASPQFRPAFAILRGQSETGIGLHMMEAAGRDGKPTTLYVIEDTRRKQCLVIGDEPIDSRVAQDVRKKGLTYVTKTGATAVAEIDGFISAAAYACRKDTASVATRLFQAFTCVCEVDPVALQKFRSYGGRVSQVLTAPGNSAPTMYTNVVKPRL